MNATDVYSQSDDVLESSREKEWGWRDVEYIRVERKVGIRSELEPDSKTASKQTAMAVSVSALCSSIHADGVLLK